MNWFLAGATLLSASAVAIHPPALRRTMGPLLDSDLPEITRLVGRLCFDVVSLLFVTLTVLFALGAFGQLSRDAVLFGGVQAAGVAVLAVVAALRAGKSPWKLPPLYALGGAAVLAFVGAGAG